MASSINLNSALPPMPAPSPVGGGNSGGFGQALGAAISQTEATVNSAASAATDLLAHGKGDVHSVALASQRAEITLELFQQVRNKFVQAYQEIMKMPM